MTAGRAAPYKGGMPNPSHLSAVTRGAVRILAATLGSLTVLSGAAAFLVTQPTFGSLPFLGVGRAGADRLRQHVEFLTVAAAPRDSDHPESIDLAASYIHDHFSRTEGRVRDQVLTARRRSYRNVIASFGPAG